MNPYYKKYIDVSLDGKYYVANVLILGICEQFLPLQSWFVQKLDT